MNPEKQVDSVRAMREIREEISREIQGMSFEQEREYIEKHLESQKSRAQGKASANPEGV